ncbi:glycosyltransferase family 4 protein [Aliidongia dinghuensis]|nr:glycosyltransferase family 4 protein [Aliidongia dinghuensis]
MKILYHHRTRAADGCRVHIEEMIASLRGLGHEVLVVAPRQSRVEPSESKGTGWVPWLRQKLPRACAELLEFGYSLYAFARLYAAYRRFRPDALYERYNLYTPTGVWLAALTRLPVLLEVNSPMVAERSEHGGLALTALADWTERLSWRSADYVLPVTRALARHVQAKGVPDERIVVIPNGINLSHIPEPVEGARPKLPLGLEGKTVLGFIGFMREWHGLDRVVELLAHPAAPADVHLLLVGDGPARAAIEAQAQALGVADRLTITGFLPHGDVPAYLAAFDIALQPAATEYASPLKLFEYLQAGRAIVAPDQSNIREILTHDRNALLFDLAEPAAFGEAILRLCREPALRERLGNAARATIAELNRTWDNNARQVVALLDQRMEQGNAAAETSLGR